jgi:hypothetical protein
MTADTAALLALARECGAMEDRETVSDGQGYARTYLWLSMTPEHLERLAERIRQEAYEHGAEYVLGRLVAAQIIKKRTQTEALRIARRHNYSNEAAIRSSGTSEGDANDSQ